MITSRLLNKNDSDISTMLDKMHQMSVENFRAWWACSNPPYPGRVEMTEMLDDPNGQYVVLTDENDVVVAWDFFSKMDGMILAGGVKHDPETNGYTVDIEPSAIEYQTKMNEVIVEVAGRVLHAAVANPRMWYALEVTLGMTRHPAYLHLGPPPESPPPLPPEAVIT